MSFRHSVRWSPLFLGLVFAQSGCREDVDHRPWRVLRSMARAELYTIDHMVSDRADALAPPADVAFDQHHRNNAWLRCARGAEHLRVLGKHTDMLCEVLASAEIPPSSRCIVYKGPRLDDGLCTGATIAIRPEAEAALAAYLEARRNFLAYAKGLAAPTHGYR